MERKRYSVEQIIGAVKQNECYETTAPSRTRVATLFPNEASCLRLVTAVAMEISDEWETGRIYLTMDDK